MGRGIELQDEFGCRIECVIDPTNLLVYLLSQCGETAAYPILTAGTRILQRSHSPGTSIRPDNNER